MASRPQAHRGAEFQTLFEADDPGAADGPGDADGPVRGGMLPPGLARYGRRLAVPLRPDRPVVLLNFVSSLDGVVTLDPRTGSGAEVSGFNEPDRFVMGLLRALADVVVVGAGTVRAAPNHAWTPGRVNRDHAAGYAAWRTAMGLAAEPITMVVSASGDVPAGHPALEAPGVRPIVITTAAGAERARATLPGHVRVVAATAGPHVTAAEIVAAARAEGARVILCEGGPHLAGAFVAERLLDELFLTLAPHLVGRAPGEERLGMLEGLRLDGGDPRWATLRSVHRAVDHLFLRYRSSPSGEA
jgi:riboflavin biosynthesis pyrimidine reductase